MSEIKFTHGDPDLADTIETPVLGSFVRGLQTLGLAGPETRSTDFSELEIGPGQDNFIAHPAALVYRYQQTEGYQAELAKNSRLASARADGLEIMPEGATQEEVDQRLRRAEHIRNSPLTPSYSQVASAYSDADKLNMEAGAVSILRHSPAFKATGREVSDISALEIERIDPTLGVQLEVQFRDGATFDYRARQNHSTGRYEETLDERSS